MCVETFPTQRTDAVLLVSSIERGLHTTLVEGTETSSGPSFVRKNKGLFLLRAGWYPLRTQPLTGLLTGVPARKTLSPSSPQEHG